MRSEKQKAVASAEATTQPNIQQHESYRNPALKSSTKLEQIGSLLLHLQFPLSQNRPKEYWAQFESMLRQYLDLKICGGRI